MQVVMVRKASSKSEWSTSIGTMRAMFGREPETVKAKVVKTITLTDSELTWFENNFLEESDIVKNNMDLMIVDENEVWHCIKVTSKNAKYSILVNSSGYDYARYTAIVSK